MISLWTKSFSVLCLGLLVMLTGNIVLVGCGEAGNNPGTVEESEEESENVNKSEEEDDERQETTQSSDEDENEDEDGEEND